MNHLQREKRKQNPREKANILSVLTFAYTGSLFKKGYKNDLEDEDLYEVIRNCSSKRCGDKMEQYWRMQTKNAGNPSIGKLLWKGFAFRYLGIGVIDLCWRVFNSTVEPYALSSLVAYFKQGPQVTTAYQAYFYAAIVIFLNVGTIFYRHNYDIYMLQLAIEIKTSFTSLLYRKSLRLAPSALAGTSVGNIVTLITKDVDVFKESIWMVNESWVSIVQSSIICYLMYLKIGPISLVGMFILLSAIPIQVWIGKFISTLRLRTGAKTDERLQITQEALSTIRIIKMYTWEKFFSDKIGEARQKEIDTMLLGFFLNMAIIIIGVIFSKAGFYALIMAYIWMGQTTNTEIIFYIVALFKDLEYNIGIIIPYGMGKAAEFYSAVVRINKVLTAEELKPTCKEHNNLSKPFVELKNVSVSINQRLILDAVTVKIHPGLTLVTGTVGSGKSSLLKAILQDYPLNGGVIDSCGVIAYASQEPWMFPSSIRQNILFGEQYDERKYQEVVKVCALEYDFSLLDKGDQTIVADGGMNLSKGQRARVNLARAVYKDCEIYLLDDSLTALDGHVQEHIFNECIKKYLADKVCVLVSQAAAHIEHADNVIIMHDSKIKSYGPPDEKILAEVSQLVQQDDNIEKGVFGEDDVLPDYDEDASLHLLQREDDQKPVKKLYYEQKKKGGVGWSSYLKYIRCGGGFIMIALYLVVATVNQGTESYSDKLLTQWVDEKQNILLIQSNLTDEEDSTLKLEEATLRENRTIKLCSIMMLVATVISLGKVYMLFDFCRRSSINLHKTVIQTIIGAVMGFFDTHFIGNVLNRFSQDLSNVDEHLPFMFVEFFRVIFAICGAVSLIVSVNIKFLLYFAICVLMMLSVTRIYQPTGRSLKRLEAATRSPMIGHLNASLEGATTVRAHKAEHVLIEEFDRHQDLFTSANYTSSCMSQAFGFLLDSVCSMFIMAILTTFLFFDKDVSAGEVGLVLTQLITFADDVQWGVRQTTEIENNMTSVERLCEYTEIKEEPTGGLEIANWPSQGALTYERVSLTYNNSEKVLKDLNFSVKPNETIGIVGRTGAGKSSVIATLFRLYDVDGRILIDGVDIKTLALKFLRKRIAIIPQDPILFSGTVRTNLDPFGEYKDQDLWNVLDRVDLKQVIPSLDLNISSHVVRFSAGQKQLICLARAILRKSKIVILDEATANLDPETDEMLHKTVRDNFTGCTVLTIAHRLHSILKCDKVIVMEKGEIREFDTTSALLNNCDGLFYSMVKQAGLLDCTNSL